MTMAGKKIGLDWDKAADIQRRQKLQHIGHYEIGDMLGDGTIYAGISPDTGRPMFAAPADAEFSDVNFEYSRSENEIRRYIENLTVGGKSGFRTPSIKELKVLFENREKGALKGTFNDAGRYYSSDYYCSNSDAEECLNFSTGKSGFYIVMNKVFLRCIRRP